MIGYDDLTGSNRDDFLKRTKTALAFRAAFRCSFTGCGQITVGPSDEGPDRSVSVGVAAHICAASPGGKRYDASMTPDQRSAIGNGIWLCATHARLVDGDECIHTVESLREMRRANEEHCKRELSGGVGVFAGEDLIALGPDVVAVGRMRSIASSTWTVVLRCFLAGDVSTLLAYIERCGQAPEEDRYVLLNEFGDGRVLTGAPSFSSTSEGYEVRCPIAPSAERVDAHNLPSDYARSDGDLVLEQGRWTTVSGLTALPQNIRSKLLLMRGESPMHPTFGSRMSEYCEAFIDSPWLDRILRLDIIRLAAIPYYDKISSTRATPLKCVNLVHGVEVGQVQGEQLPLEVNLHVNGVGAWRCKIEILTRRKPHPWAQNPWLMRALSREDGRERS